MVNFEELLHSDRFQYFVWSEHPCESLYQYPFYPKEPFSPKLKKLKSVSVLEDSLNLEKNKIAKINFIFQE